MFQANPHLIPGEQQLLLEIRAAADDFWIQQLQPIDEETRGAFDTEGRKQQGGGTMEQGPRKRREGTEDQEPNRKSQPNLELSASFLMRLSSLHWSSREVTTEMGPEVRK